MSNASDSRPRSSASLTPVTADGGAGSRRGCAPPETFDLASNGSDRSVDACHPPTLWCLRRERAVNLDAALVDGGRFVMRCRQRSDSITQTSLCDAALLHDGPDRVGD